MGLSEEEEEEIRNVIMTKHAWHKLVLSTVVTCYLNHRDENK